MIAFSHFSWNVVPWYSTVSNKIVSVSDISAVNFIVGWCVSLLVPWIWRNLWCLVYFCPTGKACRLCSVFKQLVWRRSCLNFVFQCMRPWKFWKGNCCVCSLRYRGFLLIVLSIKLERIFFENFLLGPKQETFSFFTFVFSIKFIKLVASLRCGFCN